VLADLRPKRRNRYTKMQRHCRTSLFVHKVGVEDGQAAEEGL
jgi:hypothetical protein